MSIPSYDDLARSIPDISPGEVFASVATLLPGSGPVASRAAAADASTRALFAALHGDAAAAVRAPARDEGPSGIRRTLDEQRLDRLVAIARDFSPRLERHPGGTVVLDVAGLQRLLGDAASIAGHLSRAGAPQVGVATSQTAAMLLARARPGVSVAAGDPETALRDVPMAVLQQLMEDIDRAAPPAQSRRRAAVGRSRPFDVLRRWGVTTVGEFAALPAAELSARLGAAGVTLQRLARGIDARPLVPDPGIRRFLDVIELEWPIDTLEPLSFVFARLLDPLAAALERADRGAVALHLTLRLTDRTSHARTLALPAPLRDPRVLRTLLLLDLESHPPPAAVDVVTIEIDPAPGRVVQYSLLEHPVPSLETLATLMARLGALVGETRCGSPLLLDTHRPDGWVMTPVAFSDRQAKRECARVAPAAAPGSLPTLRRFRPPVAVRVTVEAGRPVRVAVDRRGMPGGAVQQAAGPWRTSGGWWEAGRWNRDEWDVALADGAVCRLFHDRDGGQWFIEGIVD